MLSRQRSYLPFGSPGRGAWTTTVRICIAITFESLSVNRRNALEALAFVENFFASLGIRLGAWDGSIVPWRLPVWEVLVRSLSLADIRVVYGPPV